MCYDSWGCKESDMMERLNRADLIHLYLIFLCIFLHELSKMLSEMRIPCY